jgi:hypothetical protein
MGTERSLLVGRKLLSWYVNSTLLYGFGCSVTYDYERTKYWNRLTELEEVRDMLVRDKVAQVICKTSLALLVWPVMLWDDLTRIECHVRWKDSKEYEY